jgi:hypothetical protein
MLPRLLLCDNCTVCLSKNIPLKPKSSVKWNDCGTVKHGKTCSGTCDAGFKVAKLLSAVCGDGGKWTTSGACELSECKSDNH